MSTNSLLSQSVVVLNPSSHVASVQRLKFTKYSLRPCEVVRSEFVRELSINILSPATGHTVLIVTMAGLDHLALEAGVKGPPIGRSFILTRHMVCEVSFDHRLAD